MIRLTLLWMFIAWLSTIAWKDWYKGVCGLILLMAVLERPDMPHSILGIPGLNPWNILLLVTVCSCLLHKQREGLYWDMPRNINRLLVLQFLLFAIGFLRIFFDGAGLAEMQALQEYGYRSPTKGDLWINYFINTFKWVVPGLLLYYGCNSRTRLMMALFSLLAMYLVMSLLVYKAIPPWKIVDVSSLSKYATKLDTRVGYHRVDLSAMLAGASWAFFSVMILIRQGWQRAGLLAAGGLVILAQALTGGRAGYMAWGLTGLFFGLVRWRKLLIFMPITVLLLLTFIPQIRDRIMVGLDSTEETGYTESGNEVDVQTLTAGRNRIWHLAMDQFQKAPLLGHGRLATLRTGINRKSILEFGEGFGHPHCAYLEQLIDNGIIGLVLILLFYLAMLRKSFSLLRDTSNPLYVAVGGVAMAIILAQLIAALTAQSFYPRQGVVGMWCAMGLMLRVYVEREKARQAQTPALIWKQDNRSQHNR